MDNYDTYLNLHYISIKRQLLIITLLFFKLNTDGVDFADSVGMSAIIEDYANDTILTIETFHYL